MLDRGRRGSVRPAVRTVRVRARSGLEVFGVAPAVAGSPIPQGREHSRELGDVVQQQQGRCRW